MYGAQGSWVQSETGGTIWSWNCTKDIHMYAELVEDHSLHVRMYGGRGVETNRFVSVCMDHKGCDHSTRIYINVRHGAESRLFRFACRLPGDQSTLQSWLPGLPLYSESRPGKKNWSYAVTKTRLAMDVFSTRTKTIVRGTLRYLHNL